MRLRVRYARQGKIRFISHRDTARAWERALRRAGLPVRYTEGFSPRPKVHFGLGLANGHESVAEFIDIDLDPTSPVSADLDLDSLPERLSDALPGGMDATRCGFVEPGSPSLQAAVTHCTWQMAFPAVSTVELGRHVDGVLTAESLPLRRVRKGRERVDDARPAVLAVCIDDRCQAQGTLHVELATQPRSLRPTEFIEVLALPDVSVDEVRVRRTHQWTGSTGARREPLELPPSSAGAGESPVRATWTAHAEKRAS